MKVLFAVSNESITTSVISKYQQKYKEIVTSKSVYYFNAIIKELQNDKSYDVIVIGEDLEPISNNNYDAIDKFIIEKLDSISDEASKNTGEDIPIIFLCSDRRTKSDSILRKFFSMGIYNALVGNDRSLDKVCGLMNKPRNKKEAKKYYMIEDDDSISYEPSNDELVSEDQLRTIQSYYKKIGNDEKKCTEAFVHLSKQYNDAQLRLIVSTLPIEVKAILETSSPIYQKLMEKGTVLSNGTYSPYKKTDDNKPKELDFIEKDLGTTSKLTSPVIIPSNINVSKESTNNRVQNQQYRMPNYNTNPQNFNNYQANNPGMNTANRRPMVQTNQPNTQQQYNNIQNQGQYRSSKQSNNNQNTQFTPYQSRYGAIKPYNPYQQQNNSYNNYANSNNYGTGYGQFQSRPMQNNYNAKPMQNMQGNLNNYGNMQTQSNNVKPEIKQENATEQNVNPNLALNNTQLNAEPDDNDENSITNLVNNVELKESLNENNVENVSNIEQNEVATPIKKRRGRPRKNVPSENITEEPAEATVIKKRRGRPKKEVESIEDVKPDTSNIEANIEQEPINNQAPISNNQTTQPLNNTNNQINQPVNEPANNPANNFDLFNLSIDTPETQSTDFAKPENKNANAQVNNNTVSQKPVDDKYDFLRDDYNKIYNNQENNSNISNSTTGVQENANDVDYDGSLINQEPKSLNINDNFVVAGNGKIVSFVGASKNGTSFIVNNIAEMLAEEGIRVAVIDLTTNRNSYYMFTNDELPKIKVASNSLKKLSNEIVEGLKIRNNLSIFTAIPYENIENLDARKILDTASKNFDVVMLDCDLKTESVYFQKSDEIYLVQSMDTFTIQPLTKFLCNNIGVFDFSKIHIVINKYVKLKKLDYKMILVGMSTYNDPIMSMQRNLFDASKVSCSLIPFDVQTYSSYLEAIAMCKINIDEYSNQVKESLDELKDKVFPLVDSGKKADRKNKEKKDEMKKQILNENPYSNAYGANNNPYQNMNQNNYQNNIQYNPYNNGFYGNNNYNNNFNNQNMQNINQGKTENTETNSAFSKEINNTLNKMRNNKF